MSEHLKPNPFYQKDFITVKGVNRQAIEHLFSRADVMKTLVQMKQTYEILKEHAIPIIFYQPSTRTALSFMAAAQRLGAHAIHMNDMEAFSSAAKGESLPDTIRAVQNTTDASAIVLRHPMDWSSESAAKHAEVPVINAGSGKKEHPTQALLDLYTILNFKKTFDDLNIAFVGDLKNGRTVKSLALLLSSIGNNNRFTFVSPKEIRLPDEYIHDLPTMTPFEETDDLNSVMEWADVLYMTRVQKEWFEIEGNTEEYERVFDKFLLTREMADRMREDAIIMHPLPRQEEIRYRVDESPHAKYFDQMKMGLFIRMALYESILVANPEKKTETLDDMQM